MNPPPAGVDDPWLGVDADMGALRRIICETFRISASGNIVDQPSGGRQRC